MFLSLSQGFINCPGWPCSIVQVGLKLLVLCLNFPSSLDDRPKSQTWLAYISWNGGTPSLNKMEFADEPFGGTECLIHGVLAGWCLGAHIHGVLVRPLVVVSWRVGECEFGGRRLREGCMVSEKSASPCQGPKSNSILSRKGQSREKNRIAE